MQGKSAADIGDWIRENSGDAADSPEFAEFLAVQLFPHMLGPSPVSSFPLVAITTSFCCHVDVQRVCAPAGARVMHIRHSLILSKIAILTADLTTSSICVPILHMQDSSKPLFKADSEFVPLLLTFVANRSNQEVAMVWGAQKIYEDRERPKG